MHRDFRKLLDSAKGESQHIIAIVLDVRGFTPFCQTVESLDVANYIKKVYIKILDDYFPFASFYKPTGDGLLLVMICDEESLKNSINSTMEASLKLLKDFRNLCNGDPLLNFVRPSKIGIGLCRGSACCLTSEEKILDYSGRVLNLAARLMDIARPSGIVFNSDFGFNLLPDGIQEHFSKEKVFVKGIAEEEPIDIYFSKDYTLIQSQNKKPIREKSWETASLKITFKNLKDMAPWYQFELPNKPIDENRVVLEITFPLIRSGKVVEGHARYATINPAMGAFDYEESGGKPILFLDVSKILKLLESEELCEDTLLIFEARYPVN